jgi:hypothetical protein
MLGDPERPGYAGFRSSEASHSYLLSAKVALGGRGTSRGDREGFVTFFAAHVSGAI